jgi:heat shock protein HslJ
MWVTTALSTSGGDSTTTSAVPAGDPSSSRRSKPVGTDELAGRTYRSTAVSGRTLAEGTVLSLTFGRGALSATAGCNTLRGRYAIEDGRLTVGQLRIDKPKPCPSTVSEETSWLSDFLGSRPTLTRDGHRLTLATGTTTIEFTDRGR